MFSIRYFVLCYIIYLCNAFPCVPPPAKRSDFEEIKHWPENTVPYEFDSVYTVEEKMIMLQGMAELTEMTDNCIRFVPYTDQPAWVRIVDGGGCSSYHGQHQENGYQELSMNRKSCIGKDIIKHEFLHALGFIHEQSRPDRDAYIKILYENLVPDSSHNYDKVNKYSAVDLNIPYDISFYMHYNNQGFSINGLPTMIPVKDESISLRFTMGSPGGFNIKDVPRIKKQLGCPA